MAMQNNEIIVFNQGGSKSGFAVNEDNLRDKSSNGISGGGLGIREIVGVPLVSKSSGSTLRTGLHQQ